MGGDWAMGQWRATIGAEVHEVESVERHGRHGGGDGKRQSGLLAVIGGSSTPLCLLISTVPQPLQR